MSRNNKSASRLTGNSSPRLERRGTSCPFRLKSPAANGQQKRSVNLFQVHRAETAAIIGIFSVIIENERPALLNCIRKRNIGIFCPICRIKNIFRGDGIVNEQFAVFGNINHVTRQPDNSACTFFAVMPVKNCRIEIGGF